MRLGAVRAGRLPAARADVRHTASAALLVRGWTWFRERQCLVHWAVALAGLLYAATAPALTGAEVAQVLNTRYQSTAGACAVGKPAYYCSGVLIRALPGGDARNFWQHDPTDRGLGSVPFAYLRADLGTNALAASAGFVLADSLTAIGQEKPFHVRCAYPFDTAFTATLPDHGCDLLSGPAAQADPSSCAAHGVTDAASWVTHFQQQGASDSRQCSLSAADVLQFKASLVAHEAVSADWSQKPNALLVEAWDDTAPAALAIQALFYDISHGGQLSQAQRYQLQYFNATRQWLPIVKLFFGDDGKAIFGFDDRDQLDIGHEVAARIARRYADTAKACPDGSASFNCNGVLIRGTGYGAAFHSWNPSPNSVTRNGVSFSYLRADIGIRALVGREGLIMREFAAPVAHPLTLRCSFPVNAGTSSRPESCYKTGDNRFCHEYGVVDVESWQRLHGSVGLCPFYPNAPYFQLGASDARIVYGGGNYTAHNEIIIAAWPQDIPTQLPIDTLYYIGSGLPGAQHIQKDYMNTTGRFIPILKVDLTQTGAPMFTYSPDDQGTAMLGTIPAPADVVEGPYD